MRLPNQAISPLAAPLTCVLQRLAADLPAGRLAVHLCPRIAMTAEPPGGHHNDETQTSTMLCC